MLPNIQRLYLHFYTCRQEKCQTLAFDVHQEGPEIPKLASLEQISKLPPESIILPAVKDRMHLSIDPALTTSAVYGCLMCRPLQVCSQCTPSVNIAITLLRCLLFDCAM